MIINISMITFAEKDILSDLQYLNAIRSGWFGSSFFIKNYIGNTISGKIKCSRLLEIDTVDLLIDTVTCFPSNQVIETETFLIQLYCPFSANLEYDALVYSGYIGVSIFGRREIPVRITIGCLHVQIRHTYSFPELVYRNIKVALI